VGFWVQYWWIGWLFKWPTIMGEATYIPHTVHQYCTHFSGPLKYHTWFTNIVPKIALILAGLLNTPIVHQYSIQNHTHLIGPHNYPTWFTHILPKISPVVVSHLNTTPNPPILHAKYHPFEWATELPHPNHQYCNHNLTHFSQPLKYLIHPYCTQNLTHFSGPLKYPTQFTDIAPKIE
jgi:hypothetical protein